MTLNSTFTKIANAVAHAAGMPATFIACCLIIVLWAASGPLFGFSDTWQLIINTGTTIITFLMVFLIQNTQNRDGAAIQAKLDELIHAVSKADERFVGIERLSERELDRILEEVEDRALRLRGAGPPIVATRQEDEARAAKTTSRKAARAKSTGRKTRKAA